MAFVDALYQARLLGKEKSETVPLPVTAGVFRHALAKVVT